MSEGPGNSRYSSTEEDSSVEVDARVAVRPIDDAIDTKSGVPKSLGSPAK